MQLDDRLIEWATPRQAEFLQAINKHGGYRAAARALGITNPVMKRSMDRLKARAALQGYSPEHDMRKAAPDPFIVKGTSTYYDDAGKVRGQWVKTKLSDEAYQRELREAVACFLAETPRLDAPAAPTEYTRDVIPWIQIGDAHIGMLALASEVGDGFDVETGERELCAAIGVLVDEMPACERCVVNDLGDFTHYENFSAVTEASRHALDADGRFPKMIQAYSRIMRFIVEKALTKAQHVDVIVNQGNHSRTNDIWMAELLRVAYGHTGRVHVLNNDAVFIAYRMGNTLVMTHHSDKCPPARLAQVMATDFRRDWGETEHRYIDIGHVHHHMVSKEHPGVFIESFNNLAPNDKWASEAGYRSRKSITVVLRSRTYGEIGRRVLPIQEVRDRLAKVGRGRAVAPRGAFTV